MTSSSSPGAPQDATAVRVQRFRQELVGSCINLHALAGLAFYGIPDRDNLRAVVWKVWTGKLGHLKILRSMGVWGLGAANHHFPPACALEGIRRNL